jgi:hypothetical protein
MRLENRPPYLDPGLAEYEPMTILDVRHTTDPTNGTVNGGNLIRVAVTRDISQAVPVSGSFVGRPEIASA